MSSSYFTESQNGTTRRTGERVGAREGFPNDSVKLVSLANGNWYEVDSNTFFEVAKPSVHLK
jgi:hypothetical protein